MFSFLVLTLNRLCLAGRSFRWIATPGLRALTQNIVKGTMEPGISCSIVSHWGDEVTNKSIQRSKLGPIRIDTPPDK